MKTHSLCSSLAVLALCTALSLHAGTNSAAAHRPAGELRLDTVVARVPANGDTVAAGTSRIMVSMRLGSPDAVLHDGSWLYYRYTASLGAEGAERHGVLVVRFAANKVTSLILADDATVVALRRSPANVTDDARILIAQHRR